MGLTESKRNGHHYNIHLSKNPKRGDNRPAYIRKEIRYDIKNQFSEILDSFNLTNADKKYIQDYVNKHKKR